MVAHSKVSADNAVAADPRRLLDPPARDRSQARGYHGAGRPSTVQAQSNTHFRTFRSQADFSSITRASSLLDACGFYWGPLTVSAAHEKLKSEPEGTFLIRDSTQKNCFFAISVKTATGPTSIRINFQTGCFSLDGSKETFDCLFKLLEHYPKLPEEGTGYPPAQSPCAAPAGALPEEHCENFWKRELKPDPPQSCFKGLSEILSISDISTALTV